MADKLPNSRAQIASLRLSPDDLPAVSPQEKSSLAKDFWSKVWGRPPPVPSAQRVSFLKGYDVKVDQDECVPPDLPFFTEMVNRPTDSAWP